MALSFTCIRCLSEPENQRGVCKSERASSTHCRCLCCYCKFSTKGWTSLVSPYISDWYCMCSRIFPHSQYNEPCSEYQFWLALKITRCKGNVVCAPLFIAMLFYCSVCVYSSRIRSFAKFLAFHFIFSAQQNIPMRQTRANIWLILIPIRYEKWPEPNAKHQKRTQTPNRNLLKMCWHSFWLENILNVCRCHTLTNQKRKEKQQNLKFSSILFWMFCGWNEITPIHWAQKCYDSVCINQSNTFVCFFFLCDDI